MNPTFPLFLSRSIARRASLVSLMLLALLAGCRSVGPDYKVPVAAAPAQWYETGAAAPAAAPEETAWWSRLQDPVLDRLVARALAEGPDVREALARVREARAWRGVAAADRAPTVGLGASYSRFGDSEQTAGAVADERDHYALGLDLAWEIDLWGRVRRAVEAADAEVAATDEDARAVALTLTAETAATYVALREHQRRGAIARSNVELQRQTLALVRSRHDAGLVGERDVAQAATHLAVTLARVPSLEAAERAALHRLAVLLGRAPGDLAAEVPAPGTIPVPPDATVLPAPVDVLRRRPDVGRAERLLAAEHARIGVATAELYPRLSLAGLLGLDADEGAGLFRRGSDTFGVTPAVGWTVFDGGRRRSRIAAQDARTEQARIQWERTVLVALEEVENAVSGLHRGQARRESLLEAAAQARRAVDLSRFEYAEGQSDFQAVLDSQRALADIEDALAAADATLAVQFIALHKALGG